MTRRRELIILVLVSSLISGVCVFIFASVLEGQQKNTKSIESTRDDVVVAKAKVDGPDSKLSRTVRRLSRTIRKQDRAIRKLDALIRDLRAAGARLPSVVKGGRGPAGFTGATGMPGSGPTPQQIAMAVSAYCASHVCGLAPTQAQVAEAVSTYCRSDRCRGSDGKDAPPVTFDQIAAAVAAYCASGKCAGPPPADAQVQAAVDAYCLAHNNCAPPDATAMEETPVP